MPVSSALLTLACCFLSLSTHAIATFSSGASKVPLLELYSSEGCSSCQPADNWLSKYQQHPEPWSKLILLAFHVDYWNHLGWNAPFANKNNSQRQYRYKHNGNVRAVYSPGFVYNGKESRNCSYRSSLPAIEGNAGNLTVHLDGTTITATFDDNNPLQTPLLLNITLLGFDLAPSIPAGENKGKILKHNFVAPNHQQSLSKENQWQTTLPTAIVSSEKIALPARITPPPYRRPATSFLNKGIHTFAIAIAA